MVRMCASSLSIRSSWRVILIDLVNLPSAPLEIPAAGILRTPMVLSGQTDDVIKRFDIDDHRQYLSGYRSMLTSKQPLLSTPKKGSQHKTPRAKV